MATGNPLLGTLRRSVGDVTFYRRNGVQVSRARVRKIANPRTDAQTVRRIAFSSASKTAQHLRAIVSHSFQGKKYGQTSVNHFVSMLTKDLAPYIEAAMQSYTEAPYGTAPILPTSAAGIACAAKALISSGDLVGMPYDLSDDATDGRLLIGTSYVSITNGLTVTLADYESVFGVPMSDQVTIIEGHVENLDYISEDELFKGVRYGWARWNILQTASLTSTIFVAGEDTGVLKLNPDILDMERTDTRILDARFEVGDDSPMSLSFGLPSDPKDVTGTVDATDVSHAAVIVSRYEQGVWRRSTSRIIMTPRTVSPRKDAWEEIYGYNDIESVMMLAVPQKNVSEEEYLNKKKRVVGE